MQRILVTGATGFLGGAVARALHGEGASIIATGRSRSQGERLEREGISFHACDLATDASAVQELTEGCEAVVHAAALSSPWGSRAAFTSANVAATQNLLNACAAAGVRRLVHISSPSVTFDFKDQPAITEDAPWSPRAANHYIATKRLAELAVHEAVASGLEAILLRPKALFGPGDTTLLPRVLRVARRGSFPLFGEVEPLMDLTRLADAVDAVRLALRAPASCSGRVYHITSGDPQPRRVVLTDMLEACGLAVSFRHVSRGTALAVASVLEAASRLFTGGRWEPPVTRYAVGALGYDQTLDISAARRELGYAPRGQVREALRDCGARWREADGLRQD